jgi:hypothetical protein
MEALDTDPDEVRNAWLMVVAAEASTHMERDLKVATALEDYTRTLRAHKLRPLDCVNMEARAKTLRATFYQNQLQADNTADWQVSMALHEAKKATRKDSNDKQHHESGSVDSVFDSLTGDNQALPFALAIPIIGNLLPRLRHKSSIVAMAAVLVFLACAMAGMIQIGLWLVGLSLVALIAWNLCSYNQNSKKKSRKNQLDVNR